ncbi:MAG: hypothetical protein JOZ41_16055, partial [Chloroflexi bacterium]|nr:hypothetical protein [Chloroflexota bacterium]
MTDTIAADTQAESLFILERDRRLSDSFLWSLQRRSYELQGVGAWKKEDAVPHFVTTNAFIATAYARVVLAWLRDWYAIGHSSGGEIAGLDLSRPVYVVELGSGPGRFAFLFLKNFARLHARSTVRRVPFRYVMTDLAERNLAFWREHPSLRPFVEAGVLDFAHFDAEQPHELTLELSGDVLAPGTVANPLVVLANYVFDTIRQDIFSVKGGELYEARVSVGSSQPEPDLDDPEILSRLKLSFEDFQTTPAYYGDADLDCILHEYQQRLPDVSFLFPSVALRCIRYLSDLSSGRMLLLTSDKGYEREEELIDQNGPGFGAHGGTFSLVVNYHAVGRYVLHQ